MAAKLIPAAVLTQCVALTVDQVQAAMEHGGSDVKLTSAVFLGMMPSGVFVYACEGQAWRKKWLNTEIPGNLEFELVPEDFPDYLAKFKVKLAYEPKLLNNLRSTATEAIARAKRRMLADGWVVCWGT